MSVQGGGTRVLILSKRHTTFLCKNPLTPPLDKTFQNRRKSYDPQGFLYPLGKKCPLP